MITINTGLRIRFDVLLLTITILNGNIVTKIKTLATLHIFILNYFKIDNFTSLKRPKRFG